MHKIHTYYLYIAALVVALGFASCAEVDLCEENHEGNLPVVKYSFDWGKYKADAPEGMYTMAHRIINDWKRVDMISASEESDTIGVRPGEYKFLALPTKHNAFDLTEMVRCLSQYEAYGYEDYRYDESDGRVQDKNIHYKLYTKQQILSLSDDDASNEDKIARYIHPYADPFFFDSVSVVQVNKGVQQIKFAPKPITQCVDVQFYINAKTTHTVDSVHAELSGIPVSMEIGSRFVSKETASVFLIPSLSETRIDLEDIGTIDVIQCDARINVTTVLNSKSESEKTSLGLLTVTVYTSEDTPEGKKTYSTVVTRNLHAILEQAKLSVYAEDLEHIVRNSEAGKIVVKSPFTIYK